MKGLSIACAVALAAKQVAATVQGFDISAYQGTINYAAAYNSGARFVIIKVRNKSDNYSVSHTLFRLLKVPAT
jgi:GH25 family lysozyme M1 (1,4-beta-N-acetylmuramidase)